MSIVVSANSPPRSAFPVQDQNHTRSLLALLASVVLLPRCDTSVHANLHMSHQAVPALKPQRPLVHHPSHFLFRTAQSEHRLRRTDASHQLPIHLSNSLPHPFISPEWSITPLASTLRGRPGVSLSSFRPTHPSGPSPTQSLYPPPAFKLTGRDLTERVQSRPLPPAPPLECSYSQLELAIPGAPPRAPGSHACSDVRAAESSPGQLSPKPPRAHCIDSMALSHHPPRRTR